MKFTYRIYYYAAPHPRHTRKAYLVLGKRDDAYGMQVALLGEKPGETGIAIWLAELGQPTVILAVHGRAGSAWRQVQVKAAAV